MYKNFFFSIVQMTILVVLDEINGVQYFSKETHPKPLNGYLLFGSMNPKDIRIV